jgi:hypothetical protein
MKKTAGFLAAALAACLLILSACSARSPVSSGDFQKQAKTLGYKVSQIAPATDGAEDLFIASSDSSYTQFRFLTFSDASSAMEGYKSLKEATFHSDGESTVDSDAYNKYTAQNGEIYYTLIRMDNTVLDCKSTTSKKDEIESFVKAIKY